MTRPGTPATSHRDILVDFDHTLLAGNSTDLFIASCRPTWLASVLDIVLRRCLPWPLLRMKRWYNLRDHVCVVALLALTPWNLVLWKRKAPGLFESYKSSRVIQLLEDRGGCDVAIVTFGIRFIIQALICESQFRDCRLMAAPILPPISYFAKGKLDLARAAFTEEAIAGASFISDSIDDSDLLQAVKDGVLIDPEKQQQSPSEKHYLPLKYTAAAKYPRSYVIDQFLFVDTAVILLATVRSLSGFIWEILFVPLFMISLMCVYEIGYFENDMFAAGSEKKPTLTGREERFRSYPIQPGAWIWSLFAGAFALVMTYFAGVNWGTRLAVYGFMWLALLGLLRSTFYLYNRLPVSRRPYFYPLLQIEKYASLLLIVPPTAAGVCLVLSQITLMTLTYLRYRLGNRRSGGNRDILRLGAFLVFYLIVALYQHRMSLAPFPILVIMGAWLVARTAKPRLVEFIRSRRRTANGV